MLRFLRSSKDRRSVDSVGGIPPRRTDVPRPVKPPFADPINQLHTPTPQPTLHLQRLGPHHPQTPLLPLHRLKSIKRPRGEIGPRLVVGEELGLRGGLPGLGVDVAGAVNAGEEFLKGTEAVGVMKLEEGLDLILGEGDGEPIIDRELGMLTSSSCCIQSYH